MAAIYKSGTSLLADNRRQVANIESYSPEDKAKILDAIEAQIAAANEDELNRQDIRQLFRIACGSEALETLINPSRELDALEFSALDSTAFSRITKQLVETRMTMAFNLETFVFSRLIPSNPAENLHGDRIPGITTIGDEAEVVEEGANYPRAGFGDEYIETPASRKRGMIVSITREAIWQNRTRNILRQAAQVGEFLGLNKEKRLCDIAIGVTNNYKRNGTAVNTYQTATPWINDASNELLDYTDVENAMITQGRIVDPNTGEAISLTSTQIVVTKAKEITARRILNATQVNVKTDSLANSTWGQNPLNGMVFDLAVSQLMENRGVSGLSLSQANASKYWIMGDFAKAFSYEEVFPLTVTQAPTNNEAAFYRDVVAEYKASERGVAAVIEPRYVVRSKN